MSNRKEILKKIAELERLEAMDLCFSDKVMYPAFGQLDSLKKKACTAFAEATESSGLSDEEVCKKASAFSALEIQAIKRHHTEILSLERVLRLLENFNGKVILDPIKNKLRKEITHLDLSGISNKNISIDALIELATSKSGVSEWLSGYLCS